MRGPIQEELECRSCPAGPASGRRSRRRSGAARWRSSPPCWVSTSSASSSCSCSSSRRTFQLGHGAVFGLGLGITAYTLGLRHAFDADHIAAIDNTTRKLMADGQRPLSVGFFFSLGHSTIVFLLAFLFSIGVRGLSGSVEDDGSALHTATGVIGPGVSGAFLFVIGILNLFILINIVKVFRRMRTGELDEQALEHELHARGGFMTRLYGRATRAVSKPWQMYPLGVLFGLGFDTATEVALLFLAAGAAGAGLPFYAILCLPILFAAGMSLLDTIDGAFMNFAYGWAFSKPVRKIYYNITITGLSVAVALIVGTTRAALGARRPLQPPRRHMGLRLHPRSQPRRLLHRRAVRPDLGRGGRDLALRTRRGTLVGAPAATLSRRAG